MTHARIAAIAAALIFAGAAQAAEPFGEWSRPNGDPVRIYEAGGRMYCEITDGERKGFEMCHGMTKQGDAWKGGDMKHPDMPEAMSFNGTVIVKDDTLEIEGCTLFGVMCDSETWTRR